MLLIPGEYLPTVTLYSVILTAISCLNIHQKKLSHVHMTPLISVVGPTGAVTVE